MYDTSLYKLVTAMIFKFVTRTVPAKASLASVVRNASAKEIDLFTRRAIIYIECRHIGPYDYLCAYAFDPKGFFVREVNDELVSHFCTII